LTVPTLHEDEEDGILIFDFNECMTVKVPHDLLDRFLRAQRRPALIAFARRFGPLAVVSANNTVSVAPDRLPDRYGYSRDGEGGHLHAEPIEWWEQYRDKFAVLVLLASFVHHTNEIDDDAYDTISKVDANFPKAATLGDLVRPGLTPRERWKGWNATTRHNAAASFLAAEIAELTSRCGLRPAISPSWGETARGVDFIFCDDSRAAVLSLAGALTVQMIAAAAGAAFAICAGCRLPFVPKRQRRKYCATCGRAGAALKAAKKKYNAKRKARTA
jgi:hypothetical protein